MGLKKTEEVEMDEKLNEGLGIPAGAKVTVVSPKQQKMIDTACNALQGCEGYIQISLHEGGIKELTDGLSVHAMIGLVEAFRIRLQEEVRASVKRDV